jgi:serine/threonine-protein kinase
MSPSNLLEGTSYRLGRQLARGGTGAVYEAEHVSLGTAVVVKLLLPEASVLPCVVKRFHTEAAILTGLGLHPNLVQVTDFGVTSDDKPFLVMERLRGRTLKQELAARGPLPLLEAIDAIRQALAGLDVAHRAGVIHRDVKLGNLFVCDPDAEPAHLPGPPDEGRRRIKVLDFGVAKLLRKLAECVSVQTEDGALMGTPAVMSPEQALSAKVDARTDVYGAAVCLYWLVAGRGPFACCDLLAMIRAHAFEEPPPPSRFSEQPIPEALDQLLLRALAKRREDRPPCALAFAEELERIQVSLEPRLVPRDMAQQVYTETRAA